MASEGRGDYLLGNSLLQAAEETKDEEEDEERRRKSPGPTLIELQRLLLTTAVYLNRASHAHARACVHARAHAHARSVTPVQTGRTSSSASCLF